MRHPEQLVKHIHLPPRSLSECRSDDVANHRAARQAPPPYSPRDLSPRCTPGAVWIPYYWKILTVYSIIRIFIWFWQTDTVDFTFCFLASLPESYITCMFLLNVISNYSHGIFLIFQLHTLCLNFHCSF